MKKIVSVLIFLMFTTISISATEKCNNDLIKVVSQDHIVYDNICELRKDGKIPLSFNAGGGNDISEKNKQKINDLMGFYFRDKKIQDVFSTYMRLYSIIEKYPSLDRPNTQKEVVLIHIVDEIQKYFDKYIESQGVEIIKKKLPDLLKEKYPDRTSIKIERIRWISSETHTSAYRILYLARLNLNIYGKKDIVDLNIYFNGDIGVYHRPQEGGYPETYKEKKVVFHNNGITLAGTISYPLDQKPHPGILLIAGSGPQNRDGFSSRHRMFKVLADRLAKQGFVVLRYDKRGVEGSTGIGYPEATTDDFADDASKAFDFLIKQDISKITSAGIIGHSEGGIISAILASRRNDISFIGLLATPGGRIKDLILDQKLSDGESGLEEDVYRRYSKKLIPILTSDLSREEIMNKMILIENSMGLEERMLLGIAKSRLPFGNYEDLASPWFRRFLSIDIGDYLPKIKIPVLLLNGDKDPNVQASKNQESIKEKLSLTGNPYVTSVIIRDAGHMLQKADSFLNSDYKDSSVTIDNTGLERLLAWLEALKIDGKGLFTGR